MAEGPNISLVVPRFTDLSTLYQTADLMGFHSLWFTETLFDRTTAMGPGGRGRRDLNPLGVLAEAAAVTTRIRLGTVTPIGDPKPPILSLATDLANLDRLSGGRLILGLSQGSWPGEGVGEFRRPRAGGRLKETITLLKRLWSEPEVSFKGIHYNLEKASIDVRPVQASGIPIIIGGVTSASVNLAATLADGWAHPSGGIPGGAARGCDMVRRLATEAGRDPDSLNLGKIIYLSIDDNRARARERIAPLLQSFYQGYRYHFMDDNCAQAQEGIAPLLQSFHVGYNADSWCAFGPPAECAAFIRRFFDAGITTVMLCLVPPDVEQLERLHREVVSLLK